MNKKLILFDFDGVVINNSQGIYNCIAYALQKMGLPPVNDKILPQFVGPSLFDSFLRFVAPDEEQARRFVSLYRERYAPIGHTEGTLYNGITQVLCKLKQKGYIVAVCSGKPYDFVKKITEKFNIASLFHALYCPDFSSCASTKEEHIQRAIKDFGVTPEQTLMIGDTVFDIRSAKKAGVEVLAVSYGFGELNDLLNEKADHICHSPAEIYRLVTGEEL